MNKKFENMENGAMKKMEQPTVVSQFVDELGKERLPKNIRQVGEVEGKCRIYIEDYVYTFVKKMQENAREHLQGGIFLGRTELIQGELCHFIHGAILAEELVKENGEIQFTATLWQKIYEDIRKYFPGQTMQGWFLVGQEEQIDILSLEKIHRSAFVKEESMLGVCCGEDMNVWIGQEHGFTEIKGFYIYYERNEAMQEYMIGTGQSVPSERIIEEEAVHNFRNIMEKKKATAHTTSKLIKGIGLAMAAAVMFFAVNAWQNHGQMLGGIDNSNPEVEGDEFIQAGAEVSDEETTTQKEELKETDSSVIEESKEESKIEESTLEDTDVANTIVEESTTGDSVQVGALANYYEVRPGDTLVGISMSFYGTLNMVEAICDVNDIENPNAIYSGQKIKLP